MKRLAVLVVAVCALVLSACGGEGDDYATRLRGDPQPTETPDFEPEPQTFAPVIEQPTPEPTPTATPVVLAHIEQQPTPVSVTGIMSGDNVDAANCQIVDVPVYQIDGQTFTQKVVCERRLPVGEVQP